MTISNLQYILVQIKPVTIVRILLEDNWNFTGFPQLKNKRENAHTRTDIYTHKIFKG